MMNSSHAMKTCVLLLLAVLLCTERAQGLRCYECLGVTSETACKAATCQYSGGVCVTQDVEVNSGSYKVKTKSKYCLPSCPDQNYLGMFPTASFLGTSVNSKISCCKEDLCNAAVPTGGSIWTLAGVLLVSLGSVLLQALL